MSIGPSLLLLPHGLGLVAACVPLKGQIPLVHCTTADYIHFASRLEVALSCFVSGGKSTSLSLSALLTPLRKLDITV